MRPADGEASAPDFEKDLDKDPHAAKIPEFEGLNVKNEVRMRLHENHLSLIVVLRLATADSFLLNLLGPCTGQQVTVPVKSVHRTMVDERAPHLCAGMRALSCGETLHHQ